MDAGRRPPRWSVTRLRPERALQNEAVRPAGDRAERRVAGGLCESDAVPPLRELLAQRVESARRAAADEVPRAGTFSAFETMKVIHFSTIGSATGLRREKWWLPFAPDGDVLYLLEENGLDAHWVRNLLAHPNVLVEGIRASGRLVTSDEEEARARFLCRSRFERVGLVVEDLVQGGLVVALDSTNDAP
jgi:hypothetical protein